MIHVTPYSSFVGVQSTYSVFGFCMYDAVGTTVDDGSSCCMYCHKSQHTAIHVVTMRHRRKRHTLSLPLSLPHSSQGSKTGWVEKGGWAGSTDRGSEKRVCARGLPALSTCRRGLTTKAFRADRLPQSCCTNPIGQRAFHADRQLDGNEQELTTPLVGCWVSGLGGSPSSVPLRSRGLFLGHHRLSFALEREEARTMQHYFATNAHPESHRCPLEGGSWPARCTPSSTLDSSRAAIAALSGPRAAHSKY